jgi:uncharacterized protein YdaU (DUF1376 family)
MGTQVLPSDELKAFKSPQRMLVRFFQRSRDNWKQKCMRIKAEIKRYKNQAADARRSREQWRAKAEALEAETCRLESELARLRQDADKKPRPR